MFTINNIVLIKHMKVRVFAKVTLKFYCFSIFHTNLEFLMQFLMTIYVYDLIFS